MNVFTDKELDTQLSVIVREISNSNHDLAARLMDSINKKRKEKMQRLISNTDICVYALSRFEKNKLDEDRRRLYIAEFEDGTVKIGVSYDPSKRIKNLEHTKGFKTTRRACSLLINNAFTIESELKKHFSDFRLVGEYFSNSFDEILNIAQQKCLIAEKAFA